MSGMLIWGLFWLDAQNTLNASRNFALSDHSLVKGLGAFPLRLPFPPVLGWAAGAAPCVLVMVVLAWADMMAGWR